MQKRVEWYLIIKPSKPHHSRQIYQASRELGIGSRTVIASLLLPYQQNWKGCLKFCLNVKPGNNSEGCPKNNIFLFLKKFSSKICFECETIVFFNSIFWLYCIHRILFVRTMTSKLFKHYCVELSGQNCHWQCLPSFPLKIPKYE